MYFYDRFYNPNYVNPYNYAQNQRSVYRFRQDVEVQKAANAARDLGKAVKNMDE